MRLRNTLTGAVVSCSEATAARLGKGWAPVVKPAPTKKATPPRRRATRNTGD